MDATIVIPTKNAGNDFKKCLNAIFGQETEYQYEVICIDSGSKDNTIQIINEFPCKLVEILPEEFGHGVTRNLGASYGTGEYILFLTQDAIPVNSSWIQNFLDAMKTDDEIVGGFGKHLPYPDCNIFDQRDLKMHFDGFGKANTVYQLTDPIRYDNDEAYRHKLAFFSDNNSCVKRTVFERYPYEDVNFAEDQIWAKKMIEKGYKKIYCPEAQVYHSHNYSLKTYFKRYFDEYKGLQELHGYQISDSILKLPKMYLRHVLHDIKYLVNQHMGMKNMFQWSIYSMRRNFSRYFGGYLGGKYHEYNEKKQKNLDKKYSQQFEQRHA